VGTELSNIDVIEAPWYFASGILIILLATFVWNYMKKSKSGICSGKLFVISQAIFLLRVLLHSSTMYLLPTPRCGFAGCF